MNIEEQVKTIVDKVREMNKYNMAISQILKTMANVQFTFKNDELTLSEISFGVYDKIYIWNDKISINYEDGRIIKLFDIGFNDLLKENNNE